MQLFAETRLAPTIDGSIVKSQPREMYASGKFKYVLRSLYLILILAKLFGLTDNFFLEMTNCEILPFSDCKNILIIQLSHSTYFNQSGLSSLNNFIIQMSFKSLACSRNHSNTILLPSPYVDSCGISLLTNQCEALTTPSICIQCQLQR